MASQADYPSASDVEQCVRSILSAARKPTKISPSYLGFGFSPATPNPSLLASPTNEYHLLPLRITTYCPELDDSVSTQSVVKSIVSLVLQSKLSTGQYHMPDDRAGTMILMTIEPPS